MVEVICDTSFLIQLATERITNLSKIDVDIGSIKFVVPTIVRKELENLLLDKKKSKKAQVTIDYISKFQSQEIDGTLADDAIISHVSKNGGIVATIDKILKVKIKKAGGSVMSLSNNKIILE